MNTKDNRRTKLTKTLIKNALLELLEQGKPVSKITVKELCQRADINRSTFYLHYNEVQNVLAEMEDELINSTEQYIDKIAKESNDERLIVLQFFYYIKDNADMFKALLIDNASNDFKKRFMNLQITQLMKKSNVEFEPKIQKYVSTYILNGSTAIIATWITSNYDTDAEVLVNMLFDLVRYGLMSSEAKQKIS